MKANPPFFYRAASLSRSGTTNLCISHTLCAFSTSRVHSARHMCNLHAPCAKCTENKGVSVQNAHEPCQMHIERAICTCEALCGEAFGQ